MNEKSLKARLLRIRFGAAMLGEIKDAIECQDKQSFDILLEALRKMDDNPLYPKALPYFYEVKGEGMAEFLQRDYRARCADFLKICDEISQDEEKLDDCEDIFIVAFRVFFLISEDALRAIDEIVVRICRWQKIYEERFFKGFLYSMPDILTCEHFVDAFFDAFIEYQKVAPPNKYSSRERIDDFLDNYWASNN